MYRQLRVAFSILPFLLYSLAGAQELKNSVLKAAILDPLGHETREFTKPTIEDVELAEFLASRDGLVELTACMDVGTGAETRDQQYFQALTDALHEINVNYELLVKVGYPKSLVKASLGSFRRAVAVGLGLWRIGRAPLDYESPPPGSLNAQQFAISKLEVFRRTSERVLPKVGIISNCGMGDFYGESNFAIDLTSNTPNARHVLVIEVAKFRICKQQGTDPITGPCAGLWSTVTEDQTLYNGAYRLLITWDDDKRCLTEDYKITDHKFDGVVNVIILRPEQVCADWIG